MSNHTVSALLADVDLDLAWPTRFLVVDDAASTRRFLRTVLGCCPRFEVVGEADDGTTAIQMARELQPDVVLLDLAMPRMDGATALADVRRAAPAALVIILTGADRAGAPALLAAGATAFISKGLPPFELLEQLGALLDEHESTTRPPSMPGMPADAAALSPMAKKPRAVLCDDDAMSRHLVGQVLTNCGASVVAETDAVPAMLSVIEMSQPDLVVLDLWLEGTSGQTALPEIRRLSPKTAVIVYSAHEGWEGAALAGGAVAFVAKPHFDKLEQQIRLLVAVTA
ncbi:MAG: hypothetical protein QOE63_1944 [Acidimicrobiaceae bacterium]